MRTMIRTMMTGAVIAGLALPMAAQAAEQDVQQRIDALTKEVEALKQQTKAHQDKALEKWLTIGGDYRFRVDSLRGKSVGYQSAPGMMNWMGRNALVQIDGTVVGMPPGATPLVGLLLSGASSQMNSITTYDAASAAAGNFMQMLGGIGGALVTEIGRAHV